MMRVVALIGTVLAALSAAPAAAASNGTMGASSSGSVTIRVTVAPRAYAANAGTLCVAAPASGYSLRLAEAAKPLVTAPAATACTGRGDSLMLPPSVQASGATLLIVAE